MKNTFNTESVEVLYNSPVAVVSATSAEYPIHDLDYPIIPGA
ncbi:MAG: hypothetical protein V3V31_16145 [Methylococcales bacterium]